MATPGGRSGWWEVWSQAWLDIGNDPENEIVILSGTGDTWLELRPGMLPVDESTSTAPSAPADPDARRAQMTSHWAYNTYYGTFKNAENFLFGIDVPTIGAINGPAAIHFETALLCDITLCTDDTVLRDPHCNWGVPPGDGLGMVLQELMGPKRAAFHLYTGEPITAAQALEYGLVNEVLPKEQLMPRARELAAKIKQMPTLGRLMTKQIVRRPFQQRHVADAGFHMAHELFAMISDAPTGGALTPQMRRDAADKWDAAMCNR